MTEDQVAAKWWADQLRQGSPMRMISDAERLLNSRSAVTAAECESLMELERAQRPQLTEEMIYHFEAELAEFIRDEYMANEEWRDEHLRAGGHFRTLWVDYGPSTELRNVFENACPGRMGSAVFPIKTVMWINPGSVVVKCGFGSDPVELMPPANMQK